jgi:hypothetical protein
MADPMQEETDKASTDWAITILGFLLHANRNSKTLTSLKTMAIMTIMTIICIIDIINGMKILRIMI